MTPQEKANELVKKMYKVQSDSVSDITLYFSKKCALVAVDEIIELLPEIAFGMRVIGYYQQVREEIENI